MAGPLQKSEFIKIVEVGARDGLQNESAILKPAQKIKMIEDLFAAGLKKIEMGAFVSPKWVPQMADTDKVVKGLKKKSKLKSAFKDFSVLVPNVKGMELALKAGVQEVAIFGACSESFSKKNINCSIDESFERFADVVKMAKAHKVAVRGYLSTAFACPYDGATPPVKTAELTHRMLSLGVYEVSVGDTIGVATPKQVTEVMRAFGPQIPLEKIAMHFHNTRGTALANVLKSLELGVRIFDSSVGGLGGCPYAKGATGNLATEDLVYLLTGLGLETGVNLKALIKIRLGLEKIMKKKLPALVKDPKIYF